MEETINKRIRRYRRSLDYTQEYVAVRIDMTTNAYSQMECSGNITCKTLLKIVEVLGIDALTLIYDENSTKPYVKPPKPITHEPEEKEKKKEHELDFIPLEVEDFYEQKTIVAMLNVRKDVKIEIFHFAIGKLEEKFERRKSKRKENNTNN